MRVTDHDEVSGGIRRVAERAWPDRFARQVSRYLTPDGCRQVRPDAVKDVNNLVVSP